MAFAAQQQQVAVGQGGFRRWACQDGSGGPICVGRQPVQGHHRLHLHPEDGAHAGSKGFGVVPGNRVGGTVQVAVAKPVRNAQQGTQVAGVLYPPQDKCGTCHRHARGRFRHVRHTQQAFRLFLRADAGQVPIGGHIARHIHSGQGGQSCQARFRPDDVMQLPTTAQRFFRQLHTFQQHTARACTVFATS